MDAKKFDRLTQAIGAALSRRSALRAALGTAVLGSLGLSQPDVAEAARCKRAPGPCEICKKGKKTKSGKRKKGKIKPKADTTPCTAAGGNGQCAQGVCILTTVAPTTPAPAPPGPQCHQINTACNVDADCCNNTCGKAFADPALRCCRPAGSPCTSATAGECCGGGCRSDTATCACKTAGDACNNNKQCCSGNCLGNGTCS
jgi:hypothetical protein